MSGPIELREIFAFIAFLGAGVFYLYKMHKQGSPADWALKGNKK